MILANNKAIYHFVFQGYLAGIDDGLQLQGREQAVCYGGSWDGQGVGDIWRRNAR